MRRSIGAVVCMVSALAVSAPAVWAQDAALEQLLRQKVLNQQFEGFDFYDVIIEDDRADSNGARIVTVVARGRFLQQEKWMKALILLAGEQVIGGEILEGHDLPPCRAGASPVQQS